MLIENVERPDGTSELQPVRGEGHEPITLFRGCEQSQCDIPAKPVCSRAIGSPRKPQPLRCAHIDVMDGGDGIAEAVHDGWRDVASRYQRRCSACAGRSVKVKVRCREMMPRDVAGCRALCQRGWGMAMESGSNDERCVAWFRALCQLRHTAVSGGGGSNLGPHNTVPGVGQAVEVTSDGPGMVGAACRKWPGGLLSQNGIAALVRDGR